MIPFQQGWNFKVPGYEEKVPDYEETKKKKIRKFAERFKIFSETFVWKPFFVAILMISILFFTGKIIWTLQYRSDAHTELFNTIQIQIIRNLCYQSSPLIEVFPAGKYMFKFNITFTLFYKRLESGLSPQSCLYFQGFWGSKLLNDCLVVWPSNLCLQGIQ